MGRFYRDDLQRWQDSLGMTSRDVSFHGVTCRNGEGPGNDLNTIDVADARND